MNSSTNHNDSLKEWKARLFLWKKNCSGNIIWLYAKAKRPDTPPVAFMRYPTTTFAAKILGLLKTNKTMSFWKRGRRYRSYQIYRAVNPPTSMLTVQRDFKFTIVQKACENLQWLEFANLIVSKKLRFLETTAWVSCQLR